MVFFHLLQFLFLQLYYQNNRSSGTNNHKRPVLNTSHIEFGKVFILFHKSVKNPPMLEPKFVNQFPILVPNSLNQLPIEIVFS